MLPTPLYCVYRTLVLSTLVTTLGLQTIVIAQTDSRQRRSDVSPTGVNWSELSMTTAKSSHSNQSAHITTLRDMYLKECGKKLKSWPQPQWDHSQICSRWVQFYEVGSFQESDFFMSPPRHLTKTKGGRWIEQSYSGSSSIKIPDDFCVVHVSGWFTRKGALFDCHQQYPLVMKRLPGTGKDLIADSREPGGGGAEVSVIVAEQLFSTVIRYNEAFSHAFSVGVCMVVYMLYYLGRNHQSKILVPNYGPLYELLLSQDLSPDRIVVSPGKSKLVYAKNATLLMRRPPFHILQAHWPAHAINSMRNKTVRWLVKRGHVRRTMPRNQVIYLWRDASMPRTVIHQELLVEKIKGFLLPGYELNVIGRVKVGLSGPGGPSNSNRSRSSWLQTAETFVRAAAVIGPHGGAFGNIFLCSWDTTIIEFNMPWTKQTADGDSRKSYVRDLFYSVARGLGNFNFWNVWPLNDYNITTMEFYFRKDMQIDHDEVIEILSRAGVTTTAAGSKQK